jgi:hypothetical protein
MKDLGPRISNVEDRIGSPEDELPGPVVVHFREQTFESTETLLAWTRERESRARERRFEPESGGCILVTIVSRCAAGEEPSERDLGELAHTPAKGKTGEVPS